MALISLLPSTVRNLYLFTVLTSLIRAGDRAARLLAAMFIAPLPPS